MKYSLPYRQDFALEVKNGLLTTPEVSGSRSAIKLRSKSFYKKRQNIYQNPRSLQMQLTDRAILIITRKRAHITSDASIKLREVIDGTVEHIFGIKDAAFNEGTVAWITYAFNRIEYLVIQIIKETRSITVGVIDDILRRICPLPPIC